MTTNKMKVKIEDSDSISTSALANEHVKWLYATVLKGFLCKETSICQTDVTVICSNGRLKFHRLLFGTWSDLLKDQLSASEDSATLILPDFSTETVQRFVELLCTGETSTEVKDDIFEIQSLLDTLVIDVQTALVTDTTLETCNEAAMIPQQESSQTPPKKSPKSFCRQDSMVNAQTFPWQNNFDLKSGIFKTCYVCKKSFMGLHQFLKHLREHTESEGPFSCNFCSKNVPTVFLLHKHLRSTHFKSQEVEATLTTCPRCPKKFRTAKLLSNHCKKFHSKDGKKAYKCPEDDCDFRGKKRREIYLHLFKVHNKKPFQCKLCSVGYMHKGNLEDHVRSKHTSTEFSIQCDICHKQFATKATLYVHRREQHSSLEGRLIKCSVCGFLSKGKQNLKKHLETHDESSYRKFQCSHCVKMFRSKNSLIVHERTHTGETPYSCSLCDISFKRLHHLYSHLKSLSHSKKLKPTSISGDPTSTVAEKTS